MDSEKATISEISEAYNISRNHLVKVVHQLSQLGYVETLRGQGGGLKLSREPADINLGQVVRECEPNFDVVECFADSDTCRIAPACGLKGVLGKALEAFFKTIDAYTLQDVLRNKKQLHQLLHD